ncbi:MAG: virulence RhuM family protein [Fibrobacterales bacterium]|nr:virulence RhuM family protein [Fibrobacterales bacterium]
MSENQIVIYQPDGTMRLDVRLENETVWLTQEQMCELFQRDRSVITKHVRNVFGEGECDERNNVHFLHINRKGRPQALYSLDVIISVGYRVKSPRGVLFRRWATQILRSHLLKSPVPDQRMSLLEDQMNRRIEKHDARLTALEDKVDFFVQTQTPPLQGVFYDGQLWDACSLVEKLVGRAKKSILLVDSWVGPGTLDILAKKRKGVKVRIAASPKGNKLAPSDVDKFNAQYGGLSVRENDAFHDRFLVLDDKELYLVGASLKDLGKKCFAFAKMDAAEIPGIIARI